MTDTPKQRVLRRYAGASAHREGRCWLISWWSKQRRYFYLGVGFNVVEAWADAARRLTARGKVTARRT